MVYTMWHMLVRVYGIYDVAYVSTVVRYIRYGLCQYLCTLYTMWPMLVPVYGIYDVAYLSTVLRYIRCGLC